MMLSIGMMVKNECKYLRQCLESLKPIRDAIDSELIIVDTGSTDNTVEIAKEFTDKVYYHEWKDNFSEMRNITISYCKGDWFLVIDGDEVISNPNGIIQFFKDNKHKRYNTACVSVKNFSFENNENNYSVLLSPRLFKKDVDFRYEGAVHNQPKFKQPVLELKAEFVHYGYISDDKELMERKFKRTAAILKNELKNDPENIYYLFQLSVSYAMHGDFEEALNPICNAYNIVKKKKLNLKDYLYVYGQLAKTYFTNGKYQEAEDTCIEAIKDDNIYIDLHFYLARAQFMMNKNEQAIENYNIYLHKVKNFNVSQITKDITIINDTLGNSENAYLDLSIIYNRIGKFEVALEFAKKILSNNILSEAFNLIILLYIKLNKLDELRDYYKNNVLAKNIELKDKFLSSLEQQVLQNNSATREKVYKAFSKGNSEYSLLNRVRISYKDREEDLNQIIEKFDFNKLPNYYGDLIYYLLSNKVALENILSKTNDFRIKFYFNFLLSKYEKLGIKIYEYLKAYKNSKMTFDVIRIKRILSIYFFKSNSVNDAQYKEIFNDYLEYGYNYLVQVYNDNIIENELVYSIKDEEDLFIMYMNLAKKYKEDKARYLRNLRMALNACQYMKKGIQMLGEEVSQDLVENSDEMNAYKIKVKESITEMINNNNFIDAKKCIDEYEQIIKEDSEIYSMKAVIAIMENRLEDAEIILKNGLVLDKNNFDLLYNLAYLYERKELYLEAIETYEKIVFNMEDSDMRKRIIEHLNELEERNRKIIQDQLKVRNNFAEERQFDGNKMNLHIMYDSQYCDEFIHFVNENFPNSEHKFIIVNNRGDKLKLINVEEVDNVEILDVTYELNKLLYYIDKSSRIFIHYLMDYFCEIVCKFDINKSIYWPIWGGDLYNYINMELYEPMTKQLLWNLGFATDNRVDKNGIQYIYRRATIRKVKYCLSVIDGDVEILNKAFINNSKCLEFVYPNPAESGNSKKCKDIKRNIVKLDDYKNIILIGNSGNPSNNHLDVFSKLKNCNLENYCIVTPLSYGGNETYIDEVIKEGKKIFGSKFIPLRQYMSAIDYYELLSKVTIAVFNHNRQQAVGNIRVLLSLGKIVVLRKEVSTFKTLKNLGVKGLKSMDELINIPFEESINAEKNKELIEKKFGVSATYKFLREIF